MDGTVVFNRWRQSEPPPIYMFLGPTRLTRVPIPNGILIGSVVFAQLTADWPYTLQWAAPCTLNITPSYGGFGPPSNLWFLDPVVKI